MSDDEALAVAQFEELLRRSPHVRKVIAKACRESFLDGQQAGERKAASVLDAIKSVSRLNGSGAVAIEVGERIHDPAARDAILGDLLKARQFDESKVKRDRGKFSKQDKVSGGKADDKPDQDFDRGELKQGQQVEKEHTDDPAVAKEIAKDHLAERPDYYDKLEQVEGGDEVKVAADADQKLGQFLARADEVPPTVRQRVKAFAQKRYDGLVAKYGKTGAAAVLAATVLLLPVPIPGTSLVPIAIAEAISRLVRSCSNDQ